MQLTKMSTSRISGKGPPLAVSSISHLRMLSLQRAVNYSPQKQSKDVIGAARTELTPPTQSCGKGLLPLFHIVQAHP